MADIFEVNFDGLVGPTHNYSGLAAGNLASETHARQVSSPREAALQGLEKMRRLRGWGLKQAVLPPHERPALDTLRQLGFTGDDAAVLAAAAKEAPRLLAACSSAAAMWTANAATIAPSSDSGDGLVHVTPANLVGNFHRSLEAAATTRVLRAIFRDPKRFAVHDPLPAQNAFGDEGAANHTRFAATHGGPGVHLFVYGREAFADAESGPRRFPARQTREASLAVARRHRLPEAATVFARQSPDAIDAGVFHNDVIAVGNAALLFCHERAFADGERVLAELRAKVAARAGVALRVVQVREAEVSLADTVKSYLFNSQLLTLPEGRTALIAPIESERTPSVKAWLDRALAGKDRPFDEVHYLDLRQSMNNGGGPACLRLRVVLTEDELAACAPGVFLTDELAARLERWIGTHYRERLTPADLADPALLRETRAALRELSVILGLPALGTAAC